MNSPKPVANLVGQAELSGPIGLVFRDLLKNNKKEYILVHDSLDFMLFRD